MKKTVTQFIEAKRNNERITMLTAYDYSMAKLIDASEIDSILVGDSLAMVTLGHENTLQVTLDEMIHHGKAVVKGAKNTMVIIDMPFMSYSVSVEQAVQNAGRIIQETNATAVKIEGGIELVETIKAIVKAKIPVVAHVGLTPQSVNVFGGFKVQGRTEKAANQIIEDAIAVQNAGAFAVTLECIPEKLAKIITEKLEIPTIGIGAGNGCDGQVLVYQDIFNMLPELRPKFAKTFSDVGSMINEGLSNYSREVKNGTFPSKEHTFSIDESILRKLY